MVRPEEKEMKIPKVVHPPLTRKQKERWNKMCGQHVSLFVKSLKRKFPAGFGK